MATATGVATRSSKKHQQQQATSNSMQPTTPTPQTNGGGRSRCSSGKQLLLSSSTLSSSFHSNPLVVPSNTAFMALLIVPLVVWWMAVLSGVWVYEGLPKGQRVYHVMMWFDKGVLRPAGALVPFVVLLLRALVHAVSSSSGSNSNDGSSNDGSSSKDSTRQRQQQQPKKAAGGGLQLGSLAINCLTIYTAMAVARLGIYLTHYYMLSRRYLEFHIVSDHIFLAATMLICLHTEVVCLLSDMLRTISCEEAEEEAQQAAAAAQADGQEQQGQRLLGVGVSYTSIALTLLFVLALFLYLFTAADMYYTAKYYHFPLESLGTTFLVFLLFQAPMIMWLVRRRQQQRSRRMIK